MLDKNNITPPKTLEDIWERAWEFAKADQRITVDVEKARLTDPFRVTNSDFLRQCAWAIFGARRKYEVLEKRWPSIQEAFYHWDVPKVVINASLIKTQVIRILNTPRKVEGVLEIARWLDFRGWPAVHADLLNFIRIDEHGFLGVTDGLLEWLDQLPWIGRTLAAYIAKDLGFDSIKDDEWMRRLALWLGYSPNEIGVRQMALDMQTLNGERINVIDTVLWNWARTQEWLTMGDHSLIL
jgi:hypothetical protein